VTTENSNKSEGQKLGFLIFESFMAVLYLAWGMIFLFTPLFNYQIYGTLRVALGIVLVLYGIYRVCRAVKKLH
jgi:uncharacterized membrane protein HdeD (DUF308 family)